MRPSLKKVTAREVNVGARGRALQVEDSTYKGPEVTEVTECLVQAKKERKPGHLFMGAGGKEW